MNTTKPLEGKYLSVLLQGESYALSVLKVREIVRIPKINPLPHLPSYVRGVMNLRGQVIPVIDLRSRFGLQSELGERTCVVVANVATSRGLERPMGMIVDGVEDVAFISGADIEPPPFLRAGATSCLLGMAKSKGQVKLLLDVDRIDDPDALTAGARAA
ncbi:chemotaxis protein CheW [Opitutaceae bacterium EW11]|nr:chemotaxis protein CheW [Opitutaceae bacterium EW11]